ncbi:MAG: hypothetical protein JWM16_4332 [Verrucomicrobiales bacterium]|nr:hypothetical protein [Verrucomicrobiales bacterium]
MKAFVHNFVLLPLLLVCSSASADVTRIMSVSIADTWVFGMQADSLSAQSKEVGLFEKSFSGRTNTDSISLSQTLYTSTRVVTNANFVRIIFSTTASCDAEAPKWLQADVISDAFSTVTLYAAKVPFRVIVKRLDRVGPGNIFVAVAIPGGFNPSRIDTVGEFSGFLGPDLTGYSRFDFSAGISANSYGLPDGPWSAHSEVKMEVEVIVGELVPGESEVGPIFPHHHEPNRRGVPSGAVFTNVKDMAWIDPGLAYGYRFDLLSNSLCSRILSFPHTGNPDQKYKVFVGTLKLGEFSRTNTVDFVQLTGSPVSSFRITGLAPQGETNFGNAFPIQLGFTTATNSLLVMPIVNSPASAVIDGEFLRLSWVSEENIWYDVYQSSDFRTWALISNHISGTGDTVTIPFTSSGSAKFFKLGILDE